MARRIVSAREQVEMLSPWREAAAPQKLYRGMRVNLPPELVAEMREKLTDPRSVGEAGRELDLGPKILDHLSSQPWSMAVRGGYETRTGLGGNWHPNPKKAHEAAYGYYDAAQQGTPWGDGTRADFPLLMTAEFDQPGEADPRTDHLAGEVHYPQGHPMKITSLVMQPEIDPDGQVHRRTPTGGTSIELLHNPIYDRHGIHSGGPRQYTAFRRTAERADDFEWQRSFDGAGGWILVTRTPDGNPVTVKTEPTRGQRSSSRAAATDWGGRDPHTVKVDAAEQIMTRSGLTGRDFHVPQAKVADADALGIHPWDLQRRHSAEAEKFVNGMLRDNGFDHKNRGWVKVQPDTWNGRNMPSTTQAWTDGSHIHLPSEHVNQLSLIHEAAHILSGTQEGEGHGPEFQKLLHGLYHQHLGPEAAHIFGTTSGLYDRTAAADKTLEQHMRDTYEPYPPNSPNLPDSLKPHLMLPTDIAHHYREFDRPDDENTQMLKRVIGDQGIRQPLKISTDGTHALMIEGNHRLNVARQLGMSHVPVQVFMEKPGEVMTNESYSKPVPLEPHLGDWIDQNRQHLKSFWS